MLKFKLDTPCTLGTFEKHNKVKTKLISLIKNTECDSLKSNNDLIHRVDWNRSADKNRKWVKYILPVSYTHLTLPTNREV